ncbi:MAG TPA: phosphatidate cytidylyltransferase [Bacteroidia bacterium]|nr:phosphatidate cytidylyltransferase [Bacteroidia bacterium]
MNNFFQRALTGFFFVAILIGCIAWNYYSFATLFLIITVFGLWEFYSLVEKENIHPQKFVGIIIGALMFGLISMRFANHLFLAILLFVAILPIIFSIFIFELFRKKEKPFANIAYTFLGILYVAIPFTLWNLLAVTTEYHQFSKILLGYFFLMWTNDTGAYLCGRAFGKHKLFERISPKKTWEGFIGGFFLCMGIAFLIAHYFTIITLINWLIIASIVSIIGTLGDLVESLFKRSINVKDSGNILPGHGGILDRFDAVLISTPFVLAYIVYLLTILKI